MVVDLHVAAAFSQRKSVSINNTLHTLGLLPFLFMYFAGLCHQQIYLRSSQRKQPVLKRMTRMEGGLQVHLQLLSCHRMVTKLINHRAVILRQLLELCRLTSWYLLNQVHLPRSLAAPLSSQPMMSQLCQNESEKCIQLMKTISTNR